jgi:hypothetical protein
MDYSQLVRQRRIRLNAIWEARNTIGFSIPRLAHRAASTVVQRTAFCADKDGVNCTVG